MCITLSFWQVAPALGPPCGQPQCSELPFVHPQGPCPQPAFPLPARQPPAMLWISQGSHDYFVSVLITKLHKVFFLNCGKNTHLDFTILTLSKCAAQQHEVHANYYTTTMATHPLIASCKPGTPCLWNKNLSGSPSSPQKPGPWLPPV